MLDRFERVLVAANRLVVLAMMAAMLALVFANVVARYVLGVSIIWAEEVSQYLMVWVAWLGAGLAMREGRHVAVEMLQDALPGLPRRALRIAIGAAILAFLVLLTVLGFRFSAFAWRNETPVLNIPMGIPYLAIPLGAMLFAAHFLLVFRSWLEREHEPPLQLEPGMVEEP